MILNLNIFFKFIIFILFIFLSFFFFYFGYQELKNIEFTNLDKIEKKEKKTPRTKNKEDNNLNISQSLVLKKNETHKLVSEIRGMTSIEIVNTLIKLKYISSLQHAADMGIELNKAEIALKNNFHYTQDKDLKII